LKSLRKWSLFYKKAPQKIFAPRCQCRIPVMLRAGGASTPYVDEPITARKPMPSGQKFFAALFFKKARSS
jgi:hypothetical protein